MAAGSPKPIEPSPPEVSHSRGSLKRMNCAAHIWCWPTSVATMALPPEMRSISAIRCCGLISVVGDGRAPADALPSTARTCRHQLWRAGGDFRRARAAVFRKHLVQLAQHALHIAHDGHVRGAVLADLRRVDVDVDHLGVRRECRQAAGHAVVEAHAQRDQQVALGHAPCWPRSCRACPAC